MEFGDEEFVSGLWRKDAEQLERDLDELVRTERYRLIRPVVRELKLKLFKPRSSEVKLWHVRIRHRALVAAGLTSRDDSWYERARERGLTVPKSEIVWSLGDVLAKDDASARTVALSNVYPMSERLQRHRDSLAEIVEVAPVPFVGEIYSDEQPGEMLMLNGLGRFGVTPSVPFSVARDLAAALSDGGGGARGVAIVTEM
jgi:hypothetical protein